LDAVVIKIYDVCAGAVRGDADGYRPIKLAVAGSIRTPLTEERADRRKVLNAVVSRIGYVNDIAWAVGHAGRFVELAVAATARAPLAEERTAAREILNPFVPIVHHVNVPVWCDVYLEGKHKLAVPGAVRAPFAEERAGGREVLDAVIAGPVPSEP